MSSVLHRINLEKNFAASTLSARHIQNEVRELNCLVVRFILKMVIHKIEHATIFKKLMLAMCKLAVPFQVKAHYNCWKKKTCLSEYTNFVSIVQTAYAIQWIRLPKDDQYHTQ